MKVTTEIRDDHQAKITLSLDAQALEQAKRRVARQYAKRLKFPGFRPGKAPYEIVARRVGESILEEEAIESLLDTYYPQALQEAGITPYAAGKLENIVSKNPPVFELLVPLKPEVTLGDYRAVRFPYEPPTVGEEQVEEVLNSYLQMFAVLEPVSRPAEVGDVVYVDVEAYEEGKEDGEPLFADKNHPLLIEKEPHDGEWPYPGFPEEFLGAQTGDKKTLTYTYPEDADDESLRGKTVVIKAEVVEVKARSVPELDDEFAQQLGEESAESLRQKVREQLEERERTLYDEKYLNQVLDAILEQSTLKYPPQMVDEEVDDRIERYKEEAAYKGMTWEAYLAERGIDEETLRKEIREAAEKEVRYRLVLDAIAKAENLELDEKKVMDIARDNLIRFVSTLPPKEARKAARDERLVQGAITSAALNEMLAAAERFVMAVAKGEMEAEAEAAEAEAEGDADAAAEAEEAEAPAEDAAPEAVADEAEENGDAAEETEEDA